MFQGACVSWTVLGRMFFFEKGKKKKKKDKLSHPSIRFSFTIRSNHCNWTWCLTVLKVIRYPQFSAVPPVPNLLVVKEMIKRLQELRHTEQVQRAYALNCGEGATVSYEIQIRVLREFGLSDAAAELLQVWKVAVVRSEIIWFRFCSDCALTWMCKICSKRATWCVWATSWCFKMTLTSEPSRCKLQWDCYVQWYDFINV